MAKKPMQLIAVKSILNGISCSEAVLTSVGKIYSKGNGRNYMWKCNMTNKYYDIILDSRGLYTIQKPQFITKESRGRK